MLSGRGVGGLASVLDDLSLFLKEIWIYAMTRHHVEPNINILLTRNIPFVSEVRQWSHPLMIPLHLLWAKLNNRVRCQYECDVIWLCFSFGMVRSHARCGCCSIVCLQVDCKISTKNVNNFFFYLGFLSQPFTNHRTAGEGGEHSFNSSLPLSPTSQTLRH